MKLTIILLALIVVQPQQFQLPESSKKYLQKRIAVESNAEWAPFRIDFYFISNPTASEQVFFNGLIDVVKLFFRRYVMVKRVSEKLTWKSAYSTDFGEGLTVPAEAQSMSWDADMVFFVSLKNDANSDILASAGPVFFDETTLRPIFGVIIYNMGHVDLSTFNSNTFENNLQTIIHEIYHGLGFLEDLFSKYYDFKTTTTYKNAKFQQDGVVMLATPRLLALARQYFGCKTTDGIKMENNGGSGSAGSHFERTLFYNEMMTASDVQGNIVFTDFSLQFLQDTGMYRFGDIVTDPILWGKGKGCDFYNKQCTGGTFAEFCSKANDTGCSFYSTGIAKCIAEPFTDTCMYKFIYGNQDCRDQNIAPQAGTLSYFGYDSMCVKGGLSKSGYTISFSCYQYECSDSKLTILVDGQKIDCSTSGEIKTAPTGYTGSITCPANPSEICSNLVECQNQCNKRGYCLAAKCLCLPGYSGVDCMDNCSTYRHGISCVADCPAGTFKEQAIMSCLGCSYKCTTCSAINKCTVCESGYTLYGDFCDITGSTSASYIWNLIIVLVFNMIS